MPGTSIDSLQIDIKASSTDASAALDKLITRLETLEKSLQKVGMKSTQAVDGLNKVKNGANGASVTFSPKTNTNIVKTTKSTQKLTTTMGSLTSALGTAGLVFAGVGAALSTVAAGFKTIQSAAASAFGNVEQFADFMEQANFLKLATQQIAEKSALQNLGNVSAETLYNSMYGTLNEKIGKMSGLYFDTEGVLAPLETGLGASIPELTDFNAQLLSLSNNMNLSAETGVKLSDALSGLTADIASLRGLNFKDVSQNIVSGIMGETEALRKYGADVSDAALKGISEKFGFSLNISELSQYEKVQLRILGLFDQMKISYGNQAKEIGSLSNQIKVLRVGFENLSLQIGQVFAPVVAAVLPYINAFVFTLQKLIYTIAKALGIKGLSEQFGAGISDGIGKIEDGIEKTTGSAKKLNKQLSKIDEINNLSSGTSGGGSASSFIGSGIDLTAALNKATEDYTASWQKAYKNIDSITTKIANKVSEIGKGFGKGFSDSYVADSEKLVENMKTIKKQMDEIYQSESVQKLLDSLTQTQGAAVGAVASASTSLLVGVTGGVAKTAEENKDFNTEKYVSMLESLTNISDTAKDFFSSTSEIFTAFESEGFQNITSFVYDVANSTVLSGLEKFLGFLADLFDIVTTPITENSEELKSGFEGLFGTISNLLAPLEMVFNLLKMSDIEYENSPLDYFMKALKSLVSFDFGLKADMFSTLMQKAEEFTSFLPEAVSALEEDVVETISKITEKVSGFFSKDEWEKKLKGIKDAFGSIFKNCANIAIDGLNKVIKGLETLLNNIIDGLSSGADLLNKIPGVNIEITTKPIKFAEIPKYKYGGMPEDGLFYANHSELVGRFSNGRTAVANNEMIVEGIEGGVERAVARVLAPYLADIAESSRVTANKNFGITSREAFNAVRQEATIFRKSTGAPAF